MIDTQVKSTSGLMNLLLPDNPKLIALTGYGGCGKDELARPLIEHGYTRKCFGDIIKRQMDDLVKRHLGFSAFTTDPEQKARIRPILEQWGECNYEGISQEFFQDLPEYCVNTRISRLSEIEEWLERGGVVVGVRRPGVTPQTEWERHLVYEQLRMGVVKLIICNDSTPAQLHRLIVDLFLWENGKHGWQKISGDRPWSVRVSGGLGSLRELSRTPDGLHYT